MDKRASFIDNAGPRRSTWLLAASRHMKRQRSVFRMIIAPIVVTMAVVPTLVIAVWETLHGGGPASYSVTARDPIVDPCRRAVL